MTESPKKTPLDRLDEGIDAATTVGEHRMAAILTRLRPMVIAGITATAALSYAMSNFEPHDMLDGIE